jgi:anti-anti-sigma factor
MALSAKDLLTTSIADRDGIIVLSVAGEIDLATAPDLQAALDTALADDPPAMVVDLLEVTFLGSVGLQLLVSTRQRFGEHARFAVAAEGAATSRSIQLTGLAELLGLYPTVEEALAAAHPRLGLALGNGGDGGSGQA